MPGIYKRVLIETSQYDSNRRQFLTHPCGILEADAMISCWVVRDDATTTARLRIGPRATPRVELKLGSHP